MEAVSANSRAGRKQGNGGPDLADGGRGREVFHGNGRKLDGGDVHAHSPLLAPEESFVVDFLLRRSRNGAACKVGASDEGCGVLIVPDG